VKPKLLWADRLAAGAAMAAALALGGGSLALLGVFLLWGPLRWLDLDLSGDRIMLNLLWTVWVIVATRLEERDLVVTFGDSYRDYRREVGMLVPRTLHGYRPPHRSS